MVTHSESSYSRDSPPSASSPSANSVALPTFFVLRAPLLPAMSLSRISSQAETGALDHHEWTARRAECRLQIEELLSMRLVQEAIFLASPSLTAALPIWREDPDSPKGQKVERSLLKYLCRMSGRSTPFGLFAGVSIGHFGDATNWRLTSGASVVRRTRLDGALVHNILESRLQRIARDEACVVYKNPSAWRHGDTFRFVELAGGPSDHYYQQVEVEASPALVLALSADRDITIGRHVERLLEAGATHDVDEAKEFIAELVLAQVLLPRLQLSITGDDPIRSLVDNMSAVHAARNESGVLKVVLDTLRLLDRGTNEQPLDIYRSVQTTLEPLIGGAPCPTPFQVDVFRPMLSRELGTNVTEQLTRAIELLCRLAPPRGESPLLHFASRFQDRYGACRIPLLEALDEDFGIGFPTSASPEVDLPPYIAGLPLRQPKSPPERLDRRERFLLERLSAVYRADQMTLELSPDDLLAIENSSPAVLPDAFEVTASIRATSVEELNSGAFSLVVRGLEGPSGARLLGRFCHLDPDIHAAALRHCRDEEALLPGAAFAEVVFLPEHVRLWNVVSRPHLRRFEIPYLGASGLPSERVILPEDLSVGVDLRGFVILYSERLECEVVPRFTTAHNLSRRNTTVYRFLGALLAQHNCGGLFWSWGALESLPFLPRLTVGRIVLSQARWRLSRTDYAGVLASTPHDRYCGVRALRQRLRWPRHILLAEGEHLLPLDLDNPLGVELLANELSHRREAVVREAYPEPDRCGVCSPDGSFAHEIVVPFVRTQTGAPVSSAVPPRWQPGRRRLPGSNWTYCKIYCAPALSDRVLTRVVEHVTDGVPNPWYFVRYADPEFHIRFRVRHDESGDSATRKRLTEAVGRLEAEGLVWRLQFDTYEPEIERYGGDVSLQHCEQIFAADSLFVVSLLPYFMFDPGKRWTAALAAASQLLADLHLDLPKRCELLTSLQRRYHGEFSAGKQLQLALARRYRADRSRIAASTTHQIWETEFSPHVLSAVRRRSNAIRASWAQARCRITAIDDLDSIAASILHMSMNRVLLPPLRESELVLYDFLARHWTSEVARLGK